MIYIPKKLPLKYVAPFSFIHYLMTYKGNKLTTQEILKSMNYENTQYNRRWLNKAITFMIDDGILDGTLSDLNTYQFNKKRKKFNSTTFYSCEFKDIKRILTIEDKCNRLDLAGYYGFLCSTINNKTKVGNSFLSTICEKADLNKATVLKYNRILEEHHLIYMIHSTTKGKPNYYGRADDFDSVVREAYKAGVFIPKNIFDAFIEYKQLY